MEKYYPINRNGIAVGKMCVQKEGLYYCFSGQCTLNRDDIYRVVVTCGVREMNLGVLIPEGSSFLIRKKVPIKQVGEGSWEFRVISDCFSTTSVFVPIIPDEPFSYLSRIKGSFLRLQNGNPGILLNEAQR